SLACCCPVGLRPMDRTVSTSCASRHSRSTPWPIMPVTPKTVTFMGSPGVAGPAPTLSDQGRSRQSAEVHAIQPFMAVLRIVPPARLGTADGRDHVDQGSGP